MVLLAQLKSLLFVIVMLSATFAIGFPYLKTKTLVKEQYLPFAELFERRTNDAPALHYTVSAHPDISQVASDDTVIHDNSL